MRSALLSSVSHDLRTPLVAITGAASGMLQHKETLDARDRELTQIIYEEAERLNRLVGNLLEMTRLSPARLKSTRNGSRLKKSLLGAGAYEQPDGKPPAHHVFTRRFAARAD